LNQILKRKTPSNNHVSCFTTARSHVNVVTKEIFELNWEILLHPIYSSDIAPFDFHLFRSMQVYLLHGSENEIGLMNGLPQKNYFIDAGTYYSKDSKRLFIATINTLIKILLLSHY